MTNGLSVVSSRFRIYDWPMPIYDYKCAACSHRFDQFQALSESPLRACPKCGKKRLERTIGAGAAALFKGAKPAPPGTLKELDKIRRGVTEQEPVGEAAGGMTRKTREAGARLRELSDRLMPQVSPADIAEFEAVLRDAQERTPEDTAAFVELANALLDVFSLRIKTDAGELGRLRLNHAGSIQLTRAAGGARGFKNTTISLVAVERVRVGNRFTADHSERTR